MTYEKLRQWVCSVWRHRASVCSHLTGASSCQSAQWKDKQHQFWLYMNTFPRRAGKQKQEPRMSVGPPSLGYSKLDWPRSSSIHWAKVQTGWPLEGVISKLHNSVILPNTACIYKHLYKMKHTRTRCPFPNWIKANALREGRENQG